MLCESYLDFNMKSPPPYSTSHAFDATTTVSPPTSSSSLTSPNFPSLLQHPSSYNNRMESALLVSAPITTSPPSYFSAPYRNASSDAHVLLPDKSEHATEALLQAVRNSLSLAVCNSKIVLSPSETEAIAVRAAHMVDMLSEENSSLRQKVNDQAWKISQLQMIDTEFRKAHMEHDNLVLSSQKRLQMEASVRTKLEQQIHQLMNQNASLKLQLTATHHPQMPADCPSHQYNQHLPLSNNNCVDDGNKKRSTGYLMNESVIKKQEFVLSELIAQNKQLWGEKENLVVNCKSLNDSLSQQREHTKVLEVSLKNAQAIIIRLQDELRKRTTMSSSSLNMSIERIQDQLNKTLNHQPPPLTLHSTSLSSSSSSSSSSSLTSLLHFPSVFPPCASSLLVSNENVPNPQSNSSSIASYLPQTFPYTNSALSFDALNLHLNNNTNNPNCNSNTLTKENLYYSYHPTFNSNHHSSSKCFTELNVTSCALRALSLTSPSYILNHFSATSTLPQFQPLYTLAHSSPFNAPLLQSEGASNTQSLFSNLPHATPNLAHKAESPFQTLFHSSSYDTFLKKEKPSNNDIPYPRPEGEQKEHNNILVLKEIFKQRSPRPSYPVYPYQKRSSIHGTSHLSCLSLQSNGILSHQMPASNNSNVVKASGAQDNNNNNAVDEIPRCSIVDRLFNDYYRSLAAQAIKQSKSISDIHECPSQHDRVNKRSVYGSDAGHSPFNRCVPKDYENAAILSKAAGFAKYKDSSQKVNSTGQLAASTMNLQDEETSKSLQNIANSKVKSTIHPPPTDPSDASQNAHMLSYAPFLLSNQTLQLSSSSSSLAAIFSSTSCTQSTQEINANNNGSSLNILTTPNNSSSRRFSNSQYWRV